MRPTAILAVAVALALGCLRETNRPHVSTSAAPGDVVAALRARIDDLKPGMTEEQVQKALADLQLGEGRILSRTISGGKEVRYDLPGNKFLDLYFLPSPDSLPRGGRETVCLLKEATLSE